MTGWQVLKALVEAEQDNGPLGAARASDIAGDGRSVAQTLERLERCGLAESNRSSPRAYWPTRRGREVDEIHVRITAERGGQFVPHSQAGLTSSESFALR